MAESTAKLTPTMDEQVSYSGPAAPRDYPRDVRRKRGQLRARAVLLVIALATALGAVGYWYLTRDIASTDDAYTDGNAVMVAPQVAGRVVTLAVNDNQRVHSGDLLIKIDPSSYQAAKDQAEASLRVAEAQLANARASLQSARVIYPARLASAQAQLAAARATQSKAQADMRRQHSLPRQATTQQDIDNAESALRSADAQVAEAEANLRAADVVAESIAQAEAQVRQLNAQVALARAQLEQASLNLSWTELRAPQDGWVTKRNVNEGNYVTPGQALLSLVTPQIWVVANFKESELERMRPGQRVDITVDAYPALRLEGHIESMQLGSGSRFSAFPAENATGNFVKVVQRVPVKILIDRGFDPNIPLPLGLSVSPTVHLISP
ncbi:MAG: HlyD family secretion protein [Acetobacteraceae bacterium]|nr:HlyD family secretion protein [Acetobacteraceae bacterium]